MELIKIIDDDSKIPETEVSYLKLKIENYKS